MKEIKAFIRCRKAEEVIEALEYIGIKDITLIDVMGLGKDLLDPEHSKYSVKCVKKYSEVAKIEIVCKDRDVESVTATIQKSAYSGMKGDGLIYVMSVDNAIKIRTGATGDKAI